MKIEQKPFSKTKKYIFLSMKVDFIIKITWKKRCKGDSEQKTDFLAFQIVQNT